MSEDGSVALQGLLDRLRQGDRKARRLLLERACERLRQLAGRILYGSFSALARRHELDSVVPGGTPPRAARSARPERGGQRGGRHVSREHHLRPGTARLVDGVPREGGDAERTGTRRVRDALLSRAAPGRDRAGARAASAQGELPVDRGDGKAGRGVGCRSLCGRVKAGP